MHQLNQTSKAAQSLALHGGTPVFPEGAPNWPLADPEVEEVLRSAWSDGSWGTYQGIWTERLCERLAEMHGRRFVLPCSSGTYAVEAAVRGLGVGVGDEVILAAYDFPGNFRAIEQVGARPVLVDIAKDHWSIDPAGLDAACSEKVRAVIVSHLHGTLAPIGAIEQWARARGIALIEDACQVPGATIGGQIAGSFGDASVLSFGGSKLLTAGRGGALLTDREDLYQRAKIFGHRGNDAFPLSQLQAAVLLPQLDTLAARNLCRQLAAKHLRKISEKLSCLHTPPVSGHVQPSYYKFGWYYRANSESAPSKEIFIQALEAEGLAIGSGFRGFARRSSRRCRSPVPLTCAKDAVESTLLLHHPILLSDSISLERVGEAFEKVHNAFFV